MVKLRGKTPVFTCVFQGEVRHVLSVKILVSSETKAYLQLRSEELGLPLRCLDAQQEPFSTATAGEIRCALLGLKAGVPSKQDLVLKIELTVCVLNFTGG